MAGTPVGGGKGKKAKGIVNGEIFIAPGVSSLVLFQIVLERC